jgi:hypothetical protein
MFFAEGLDDPNPVEMSASISVYAQQARPMRRMGECKQAVRVANIPGRCDRWFLFITPSRRQTWTDRRS